MPSHLVVPRTQVAGWILQPVLFFALCFVGCAPAHDPNACIPAECGGARPVCNSHSGLCEGCSLDAQCRVIEGEPPRCGASGRCVCIENADCAGIGRGPVCDTGSGVCVACVSSGQCSGNTPLCSANRCTACTSDAGCLSMDAGLPTCSGNGACVP